MGPRSASSYRDNQLPRVEPTGRDVRGDDDERLGVEDPRARRRFSDHRRGTIPRSGHRRGGLDRAGQENIRVCGAHTIVENMRHGMEPKEACLDALKRISRNYNDDKSKLAQFDISFYALRKDGVHSAATLWKGKRRPSNYAVNDGGASRHEPCAYCTWNALNARPGVGLTRSSEAAARARTAAGHREAGDYSSLALCDLQSGHSVSLSASDMRRIRTFCRSFRSGTRRSA